MLGRFVDLLPARLRPFSKAVYPFAVNVAYAGLTVALTGTYDDEALRTNLLGLAGVLLTFLLPNKKGPDA